MLRQVRYEVTRPIALHRPNSVGEPRATKSISEETTFEQDVTAKDVLLTVLARLGQDVGYRLRQERLTARTIGIKVRYTDFTTITRAKTLASPVSSDPEIIACAKSLLERLSPSRPVRLLGVAASNLTDQDNSQPALFKEDRKDWDIASKAVDSLRRKFGKRVITMGAALRK